MISQLELKLKRWWQGIQPPHLQSILHQYQMPPLERIALRENRIAKMANRLLSKARVLKRAVSVSVSVSSIEDPQTYQQTLRSTIQAQLPRFEAATQHSFTGNKVSELNQFLKTLTGEKHSVHLSNSTFIEVDEPLWLPTNVLIDGHGTHLVAREPISPACVHITQNNVGLTNVTIQTPGLALLLQNARQVILRNLQIPNSERGIAIVESGQFIELVDILIHRPRGGMLIQGAVSHLWLHDSYILHGSRGDNGGAGVVITDSSLKSAVEEHSWGVSLTEPLWPVNHPAPHALLIENNELSGHVAQGIYVDGGYGIVIRHNRIEDNDKEGMCLDFGAVNNLVMENVFLNNGWRARQSDEHLQADFVLGFGRLANSSSTSKLPAISLDNAAQNLILWNVIRDSAGDGIKVVRTGIRNLLLFNTIMDNNRGESSSLHFSGVLLGNAHLEEGIDSTDHPLDFLPPLENIVAGNIIYGKHYNGILLDHEAMFNDIYDNLVRHFRHAPIAQATLRYNSIVGNSWQLLRRRTITIILVGILCLMLGYGLAHTDLAVDIQKVVDGVGALGSKICQVCSVETK
jgi:hypothetical protein